MIRGTKYAGFYWRSCSGSRPRRRAMAAASPPKRRAVSDWGWKAEPPGTVRRSYRSDCVWVIGTSASYLFDFVQNKCSCPRFLFRQEACKHKQFVQSWLWEQHRRSHDLALGMTDEELRNLFA